ncbi:hypothetical protein Tco_0774057 [Tanacetum coccineum]|uniref:Uncharacterized protein n=1 Tax=Tanacetum coccineum TaxID=301880 RepID=A0ABQ4ZPN7_9ASTR
MLASPVTQDSAHADASSSNHQKRKRQQTHPTVSQREGHHMFELEASQQPLEVEWPSYIQPSIPQAHMPCDDGVQHNAVVKGVPHLQNESTRQNIRSRAQRGQIQSTCTCPATLKRIASDVQGTTSGCEKRIASPNIDSDVFQVQPHIGAQNVRPRLLANFADIVDGSIVGVTWSLQNPFTGSIFLHNEVIQRLSAEDKVGADLC